LYEYRAQVVDVYDGDSIIVDIDLGFGVWLRGQKIRLFGIATEGVVARDALRARIMDRDVTIKTHKDTKSKHGRWLAEVALGDEDINRWLLDEVYAMPY